MPLRLSGDPHTCLDRWDQHVNGPGKRTWDDAVRHACLLKVVGTLSASAIAKPGANPEHSRGLLGAAGCPLRRGNS